MGKLIHLGLGFELATSGTWVYSHVWIVSAELRSLMFLSLPIQLLLFEVWSFGRHEWAQVLAYQCDQMATLFGQYLAFFRNELLPKSKTVSQFRFKVCQLITEWTLRRFPTIVKILRKWRNFAKSGHTVAYFCSIRRRQNQLWNFLFDHRNRN